MPTPPLSDETLTEAIEAVETHGGNITVAAEFLGIRRTTLQNRLRAAEFSNIRPGFKAKEFLRNLRVIKNPGHPQRVEVQIDNGVILVAGDCHYWPNYISTAHRALVQWCKKFKPALVVMNGDILDCPTISRHPPIGWTHLPSLADELSAAIERMDEIRKAAKNAKLVYDLGNHDARFETKLATVAPEFKHIRGTSLKDHFPEWWPAWSCWVNDDLVIKHRWKGGRYAPANNTREAGRSIITNHLHKQDVAAFSDYNGTRFGCDTGCVADLYGPQFIDYTEDSPEDWRSGFCMATIRDGKLQNAPELIRVMTDDNGDNTNKVDFRGEIIEVG